MFWAANESMEIMPHLRFLRSNAKWCDERNQLPTNGGMIVCFAHTTRSMREDVNSAETAFVARYDP